MTYSEETDAPISFIVKSWPPFELLPKESIKGMFIMDMKGYTEFDGDEWYPRPTCYLASYDEAKDLWALVMDDVCLKETHCVHENPLNLDKVKTMIPGLVEQAVRFEGCNEEASPMKAKCAHFPPWHIMAGSFKEIGYSGAALVDEFVNEENPFSADDPASFGHAKLSPWKAWKGELGCDYAQEFFKSFDAFMARADPANGATCTVSHGDLRGDNLFWNEKTNTWSCIDFQLCFQGPIASDLAYLMSSATVEPDVYENHGDEICQLFYDQFMAKTTRYKDLTFETFKAEYVMMAHTMYVYYVAMGAAIWKAGTMDHDGGLGACIKEGGVGSGDIIYAHLPESEKRKRFWWRGAFSNFREIYKQNDCGATLETLAKEEVDFKAAFDTTAPRACPWPFAEGKFVDVSVEIAMALSAGALPEAKANEIAVDGLVSMEAFNKVVIPGWSLLAAVKK